MDYTRQFDSPHKGAAAEKNAFANAGVQRTPLPPPPQYAGAAAREPMFTAEVNPLHVSRYAKETEESLRDPSPLYPPPVQRTRCRTAGVMICRVVVALLAAAIVVFTIVGQLLPFCMYSERGERDEKYSVWQEIRPPSTRSAWWRNSRTRTSDREDNIAEKVFAVLSAALSLVACALCFAFVGLWARHEQRRQREADAYTQAQRCAEEEEMQERRDGQHGSSADRPSHRRPRHNEVAAAGSAPSDSPTTANPRTFGATEKMYERERQRRRVDHSVGTAAFVFLLVAAVAALVTVALMADFYTEEVADEVEHPRWESASYLAGFGLFIAALASGVVASALLALPCLTELYLCCDPQVRTPVPLSPEMDSAAAEGQQTPLSPLPPPPATQPAGSRSGKYANPDHHHYHDGAAARTGGPSASAPAPSETQVHRATPHGPPPQPYVPTVVGTYPEALPGPASMEHVTLHRIPRVGDVDGTTAFPATQAAWRSSDPPSAYLTGGAPAATDEDRDDS
ncbi:hypothetical protein ABB37_06757 [Leptomonas pyrrhocoris]|uniref:Transmembrane protein n=1 Tax=Leptomonas pyrrhocoris TaxID=157538 RepID=A0A0N0DTU5_LEPPY|nr:hypothetical protein ABB37_06757 [Leptomonas pyrrhocoris]KPA77992.1 hypothetical protein ABB37_06757 [Leptomonas pyrrhocoris]|eukprot:XP_015656431.1 hypothetical protein ABB37_06757 [Leptomonas pyrrhocoris]